jgi:putative ABC transport system substrate-binding protein
MPNMKNVGLIWNSGDAGGENLYKRAKAHLDELGLTSVEAPITGSADTVTSAQSLVGRVDVIQLPCDSETLAGVEGIISTAKAAKIPVFGCTGEAVSKGAILAGAFDYTDVGRESAKLIDQILKGADPGTLAVVVPDIKGSELNLTVAGELGLDVPADIRNAAVKTY